jgi:hypothetical protein
MYTTAADIRFGALRKIPWGEPEHDRGLELHSIAHGCHGE